MVDNSSSLMNIEHDHIDYHKDFLHIVDAKFKIFKTNSPVKVFYRESDQNVNIDEVYKKLKTIIQKQG